VKRRIAWTLIPAAIAVLSFALRGSSALSESAAREQLRQGALLIDVRTAGEFSAGHLTNAINIPLDQLKQVLPRRVPDQGEALLLYCRSGRRSGIAERELRWLGYTNVFNLGSLDQARQITDGTSP
jgi:phage shock protein E